MVIKTDEETWKEVLFARVALTEGGGRKEVLTERIK